MGGEGIYTHTVAYEKDPQCTVCSSGISMTISESKTLEELLAMVSEHPSVQGNISAPSVSYGSKNLYVSLLSLSLVFDIVFEGRHNSMILTFFYIIEPDTCRGHWRKPRGQT